MSIKQFDLSFKRVMIRIKLANELWYHRKGSVKHKMILDISMCEHDEIRSARVFEFTILYLTIAIGIKPK